MRVLHDQLIVQRRWAGDGLLARVFGASLDASLAAGRSPESSRLLGARARDIVALPKRQAIAACWEHLLRVARSRVACPGPATRSPVALVCADAIVSAEPVIRELRNRLVVPLPVPARGVAMARILLTDATGPVYSRCSRVPLAVAVENAVACLDPALPLIQHSEPG
jgi:hypothetical protein